MTPAAERAIAELAAPRVAAEQRRIVEHERRRRLDAAARLISEGVPLDDPKALRLYVLDLEIAREDAKAKRLPKKSGRRPDDPEVTAIIIAVANDEIAKAAPAKLSKNDLAAIVATRVGTTIYKVGDKANAKLRRWITHAYPGARIPEQERVFAEFVERAGTAFIRHEVAEAEAATRRPIERHSQNIDRPRAFLARRAAG